MSVRLSNRILSKAFNTTDSGNKKRFFSQKNKILCGLTRLWRTRSHIRGVAYELAKEDLFVGVEGIDDETKKLVDLRLKSKGLCLSRHGRIRRENAIKFEEVVGGEAGCERLGLKEEEEYIAGEA